MLSVWQGHSSPSWLWRVQQNYDHTVGHIPYMDITGLTLGHTSSHKKAWLKKGRLLGSLEECTGTSRAGWLSVQ